MRNERLRRRSASAEPGLVAKAASLRRAGFEVSLGQSLLHAVHGLVEATGLTRLTWISLGVRFTLLVP